MSLINTINSITSVDLERMVALPVVGTQSTHGGYCGSAVKPIALNMVAEIARDPQTRGLPICGIGGIGSWRDAAEFVALGCGAVQVCTAAMLHGFRIVEDMQDGLARWMDSHGYQRLSDFSGGAVGNTTDWKYLDINYQVIARIDQDACIGCGRCCHIACEDTSHQAIASLPRADGTHRYEVIDAECVGCNLCQITCPVENCIENGAAGHRQALSQLDPGSAQPLPRSLLNAGRRPHPRRTPPCRAPARFLRAAAVRRRATASVGSTRLRLPSRRGPADAPGRPAPHGDSRMSADSNYSQQPVPLAARKSALALSVVMLGLTFFPPACGPAAPSAPA